MRVWLGVLIAIALVVCVAATAELKIEVTHKPTRCTQLTKKGDKISVHYEGRLSTEKGKVGFVCLASRGCATIVCY
jgi:hypothetical protein